MILAACGLALAALLAQETPPEPAPAAAPAENEPVPAADQAPPPQEPRQPWSEFCCFEKGRVEKNGMVTVVYSLNHAAALPANPKGLDEFKRMLTPFLTQGKGSIETSDHLNALTITDTRENVAHIENLLHMVHRPDAPILIEAKVVELRWDSDLQVGFEGDLAGTALSWVQNADSEGFLREVRTRFNPQAALTGAPFQGSVFRFHSDSAHRGSIGGLIQMFVERGKAQILSQPRILVRADQTATIFAGEDVPYPAEIQIIAGGLNTALRYKSVGVKLEVTPQIVAPGMVGLRLKPEVSSTFGYVQISQTTQAPQFTIRNVSTDLIVRDGEEVVIGGLLRKDKSTTRRGIPILMDIPILGFLFGKYEEDEVTQEVLFYIKPTVIKTEADMPRGVVAPPVLPAEEEE